eukprot:2874220-Rhodomonas_salina.8
MPRAVAQYCTSRTAIASVDSSTADCHGTKPPVLTIAVAAGSRLPSSSSLLRPRVEGAHIPERLETVYQGACRV